MAGEAWREVDLRGIPMPSLPHRADEVIAAASGGEFLAVLADSDVVVKYLTPTAAVRGVRCRFGPAVDGVWRVELLPKRSAGRE